MLAASYVRKIVDDVCAEFGLTNQQYNILRILRGVHPEGHRCAGIRERMIDRAPDITRRLDTLEEMGLVRRRRSTEDRRAVITYITQKGLDLLSEIDPWVEQVDSRIAENLSIRECRELSALCEKLYGEEVCQEVEE